MKNATNYTSERVVEHYASAAELQPAEQSVLELMRVKLRDSRMLDIGIGGGRTSLHFGPLVKEYVGGDFSSKMVDACRKRFGESPTRRFVELDARNLSQFSDGEFDFVLFSFNGIDEVEHQERRQVFYEVLRVLREGGTFVFSTHNLQNIPRLYSLAGCGHAYVCAKKVIKVIVLLLINGRAQKYKHRSWAIINDGVHRFRLRLHYVMPRAQREELFSVGFSQIKAFGSNSGELISEDAIDCVTDPWVYFYCNKDD